MHEDVEFEGLARTDKRSACVRIAVMNANAHR